MQPWSFLVGTRTVSQDLVSRHVELFSRRTLLILVENPWDNIALARLCSVFKKKLLSALYIFCSNKNVALDCVAPNMFSHWDSVRTVCKWSKVDHPNWSRYFFFPNFSLQCCLITIFISCSWFITHISVVLTVLSQDTWFNTTFLFWKFLFGYSFNIWFHFTKAVNDCAEPLIS